MRNIFILHPGKANYPEIEAYKDYFSSRYSVFDGVLPDYESFEGKSETILWCIMGFFPKELEAGFVIHDYRSLSIEPFAKFKDLLKGCLNVKPDLRIFQNEQMRQEMGFSDSVRSILLPMGVPDFIYDVQPHENSDYHQKYCYIGVMSYERKFNELLDAFLTNTSDGKLLLVGQPEEKLYQRYKQYDRLMFIGRKPQKETLSIVKSCSYAVSFFPYHRPHKFQAPTKLLEYMALGVSVVANDAPTNITTIREAKYKRFIISSVPDMFMGVKTFGTGCEGGVSGLEWHNVIKKAGVDEYFI